MDVILTGTAPQREMVFGDHPVQIWVCGRRWGKTFTARNKMIRAALRAPKQKIWYVAPTYGLCREQYDEFLDNEEFYRLIKRAGGGRVKCGLQPYPRIQLFNGSELAFRSGDRPKNLRGGGLDDLFVDEAAWLSEELVWTVLRPKLSDRRGRLHLLSTFRGKNWFHGWYLKGLVPDNPQGAKSFCYPSPVGIAFEGPGGRAELERLRAQVTAAVWEQEYLCLPQSNQAGAFKFVRLCETDCKPGAVDPDSPPPALLGWDTGKTSDPSGIVILHGETGEVLHAEVLELGTPYDQQLARVVKLAKQFRAAVIVDSTGAGTKDAIVDFVRTKLPDVYAVQFKGRMQETIVNQLDLDMQQRRVSIWTGFGELLRQLLNYEYEVLKQRVTYGAPAGEHDDLVAALAMANWARAQGWTRSMNGQPLSAGLL